MEREVVVQTNIKVYKMLKNQMEIIFEELQRISVGENIQPELLDTIKLFAVTMQRAIWKDY